MLSNSVLKFFQGGLKQYCGTQWLNIVELFNKCSASALSDVDLFLTENGLPRCQSGTCYYIDGAKNLVGHKT